MSEPPRVADVKAAIAAVLEIDPTRLADSTAAGELPQWDSLGHLIVVAELEMRFGTRFSMEEILSARTVSDLAHLLAGRQSSQ